MTYLNTFLIEEESQFECDGVFDGEDTPPKKYNHLLQRFSAEKFDENLQMHLIVASHRHMPILKSFYEIPKANPMITCIGSERLECINQDTYDRLHRKGGFIKYLQQSRFRSVEVESSIGEDIEIFLKLIKLNQYSQEIDNTFFKFFPTHISPEWFASAVRTFKASSLSPKDENELKTFGNHHGFKHRTKIQNTDESNYALSICFRKTSTRPEGIFKQIYNNYATEQIPQTISESYRRTSETSDSDTGAHSIASSDSGLITSDYSDPETFNLE